MYLGRQALLQRGIDLFQTSDSKLVGAVQVPGFGIAQSPALKMGDPFVQEALVMQLHDAFWREAKEVKRSGLLSHSNL